MKKITQPVSSAGTAATAAVAAKKRKKSAASTPSLHSKLKMKEKSVENERGEPKAKKAKKEVITTNEIDDIFASSKKKKVEDEEVAEKEVEEVKEKAVKKLTKKKVAAEGGSKKTPISRPKKAAEAKSNLDDLLDPNAKKKGRKYVDGLPVYTYEELGISAESGGTPLCPFDCDCCH